MVAPGFFDFKFEATVDAISQNHCTRLSHTYVDADIAENDNKDTKFSSYFSHYDFSDRQYGEHANISDVQLSTKLPHMRLPHTAIPVPNEVDDLVS